MENTTIYYLQMKWNVEGRLSFDEIWDLELVEGKVANDFFKIIGMYKVVAQKRVIAILYTDSADKLDQAFMGHLPLREYLEMEVIWPLREFDHFLEDCRTHFGAKNI